MVLRPMQTVREIKYHQFTLSFSKSIFCSSLRISRSTDGGLISVNYTGITELSGNFLFDLGTSENGASYDLTADFESLLLLSFKPGGVVSLFD